MTYYALNTNACLRFSTRNLARSGYSGIFNVAVCGGVFCTFAYDRARCYVVFINLPPKFRCESNIRFSADISIDMFIDTTFDISIDMYIDILICRCIGVFYQTLLLTCSFANILTGV